MPSDVEALNARLNRLTDEQRQVLRALENDWRRMSGNHISGHKPTVDPSQMQAALPFTFLLTRAAPGVGRIRVAGQKLHEMLGMDPRGMPLGTFFTDGTRDTIGELFETCLTMPAIVSVPLVAKRMIGSDQAAEILMLPMHDVDGKLTRVLGGIVAQTRWAARGSRFELASGFQIRCDMLDGMYPDRRRSNRSPEPKETPRSKVAAAINERGSGPRAVPDPDNPHPYLRLIVDND